MTYADFDHNQGGHASHVIDEPACGVAAAVDLVGDRWSLLIIREALYGVTRFDAMQANLSVPRTVLSGRLKKLCEHGVLQKRRYQEPGQRARHQYVLTPKGVDLALPMIALMQWGDEHCRVGQATAVLTARASGAKCRVGLITEDNEPVDIGSVQLRKPS